MEEKILTEITETCEHCNFSNRCLKEDCTLWKIEQLVISKENTNWNKLKKWINEQKEFIKELPTYTNDIMNNHIGMIGAYNNVLEEMIELDKVDK